MKHFSKLAALLLGAAMIFGFAGCANSTDSNGSDGSENVVYTLKNGLTDSDSNPISMTISYKNKSGVYVNEQTIPVNGTYEIPANDAKTGTVEYTSPFQVKENISVIYVKINEVDCCMSLLHFKEGICKAIGVGKYGDLNFVLGTTEK